MVFSGKKFYKDFLHAKEGIATNILSDRLKKLEKNGVIASRVYPHLKTKKAYSLTEKGKALVPVLVEMIVWSAQYQDDLAVTEDFLAKVKTDREGVIGAVLARLA